jgi:hypothetical protein
MSIFRLYLMQVYTMKWNHFLLFFSFILSLHTISIIPKTEITNVAIPPEIKNIHMEVTVKNKNANNMAFEPIINLVNKFKPKLSIQQLTNNYIHIKGFAQTQSMALNDFVMAYCKTHKTKIALVSFGSSYSFIFYKLLFCAYSIVSHNNWGSWKDSVPFDVLRIMPQQELAKELLFTIQKYYQTSENLTDFLLPLISFLRDVDLELKILNHFLIIHKWLQRSHLSLLFPQQEKLIKKAHEKMQRLTYLKGIFLDWVTDYKIAINTLHN